MKARNLLLIIAVFAILSSCKERNELINLKPVDQISIDSNYVSSPVPAAQEKHVLLEDFTGVQCVNCPAAQIEAEDIRADFNNRVVIISIHTTAFAKPYPNSKYDFRTADGDNILSMLGQPASLPVGAIDRVIFQGNTSPLVNYPQWRSYISGRLAATTPVNINILKSKYNSVAKELNVIAKIVFTEAVQKPMYLTMGVIESGIIDVQLTPTGKDTNYVHKHALRRIIQSYNGVKLNDGFEKGKTYVVSFSTKVPFDFPKNWEPVNLDVIAFVHERGGSNEVLQVTEAKVEL